MSLRPARRQSGAARMQRRYRHGPLTYRITTHVSSARATTPAPPTAPTFVLVHGIGMSHRYLSRLHEALAEHGSVYSIDMPGHAGLPKPGVDVDVTMMARGLAGAVASLGAGPAVLIGHSMGTQWITAAALESSDLVDRLVLIGPVTDSERRSLPAQAAGLARDSLGEPADVNGIVFTDYLRCGMLWYSAQARHMLSYPIEDEVARLAAPMLIIRGGRDPIAKQGWCERLQSQAADAELVTIPDHNHVVQHSAPNEVARAILTFASAQGSVNGVAA